ncbi:tRNA (adenosine(37)-N6)-threonylcarbamoyltransferase complex dimerization subunit type 1 TsaB [Enterobacteriaceae endosymbiont of Neohaemonia nigricornis]|uniref:tRNA (adenosine(37)-N6)-threonylcarbamoyltransferase complex dimerization subunit type 1 TsaB n=1 Tax=Enterobacteriaceae endosymbiont of Neohaemonia nigricornis TaxID=2675792 RepID=UPI00144968EB|nr:tRNA (adenosine(37)-N6)-threonylcarbamoyltransferase complex dimerization subunit type 1 TsaB [Enterobacteriaceae endosymbiont of Neohaemonia nigricornis]QJC30318.1 tRNA (adenosine(37)-N6)-threonylcarbamoyltransferase complex dimerization subunit type 1 TsaB [Enterobacteriaceae endosymbiont of Neohaemonia nigricornis]
MYKNILTINSCHENCTISLKINNILTYINKYCPNNHTQFILILINKLLHKNNISLKDIHLLGYALGPGNFTSIRVGMSIIEGISFALNIPKIGISNLMIIAEQAWQITKITNIISIIKYNNHHLYFALYKRNKKGLWIGQNSECILHYNNIIRKILSLKGIWLMISNIDYNIFKINIKKQYINHYLKLHYLNRISYSKYDLIYIINNIILNHSIINKQYKANYLNNMF